MSKCGKALKALSLHPSIAVGGRIVTETCENECAPGLVVCWACATHDTLVMLVQSLLQDYERDMGKPHRYMAKGKKRGLRVST